MDPVLAAEIEAIVNRTVRTALGDLIRSSTGTSTGVTYSVLGDIANQDIMAVVYLVMMEAMKSAQEDLKAIMAQVKATNATKAALRCLVSKVGRDLVANVGRDGTHAPLDFSRGMGSEDAYHAAPVPYPDVESKEGIQVVPSDLIQGRVTTLTQLQAVAEDLRNRLDSLSELGEMESLRVQMMMDRRSKMMETLSNILKRTSETGSAITQNMK